MVGPLLEQLGLDLVTAYWTPDGNFPDHEPNPLLPENRAFIMEKVVEERRRPRDRVGRRRRPLLLHRRHGRVRRRRLPHRAARARRCWRSSPARRSSTTCAPAARCATRSSAAGGTALVNRVGHAFFKVRMRDDGRGLRRRGLRPLLLPRVLQRRLGHAAGAADPRAAVAARREAQRAAGAAARAATSSPARSTPRSPTSRRRWPRSRRATPTRAITHLDGVSVDYDDWHFNVRPSNTEPLLRLCLESLVSARRTWSGGATRCSR